MAKDFSKWQRRLFTEAGKGNIEEAHRLVREMEKDFPEKKHRTSFWKAALYCSEGQNEKGLSALADAEKEGVWWHPDRLLLDPDFESVRDWPRFQEIIGHCKKKLKDAQTIKGKPELIEWPSTGSPDNSLVFSIHWRGDDARHFASFWDDKRLRDRFLLAFPQSSQVFGPDSFCWDDWDRSKQELFDAYRKVDEDQSFDRNKVVMAGASQGGKLAIELALEGNNIPAKGFVAIVPAVRKFDQYTSLMEKAAACGIRGAIITGDQDHFYSDVKALHAAFEKYHLPCKFLVSEGLGHFIPDDFPDSFLEAADFVLGGS